MRSGRKQALLKPFQGWYPAIPALIQATREDAILRNGIYDRPPLMAWSRVTLLGDAAHPVPPNQGQGLAKQSKTPSCSPPACVQAAASSKPSRSIRRHASRALTW